MKNVKQAFSVIVCSSVVFFSPGFSCYQALAGGFADMRGDAAGEMGLTPIANLGSQNLSGAQLSMAGIGQSENFGNLSEAEISGLPAAQTEAAMQPQAEAASKSEREAIPAQASIPAESLSVSKKTTPTPTKGLTHNATAAIKTFSASAKDIATDPQSNGLAASYEAGERFFDAAGKTAGSVSSANAGIETEPLASAKNGLIASSKETDAAAAITANVPSLDNAPLESSAPNPSTLRVWAQSLGRFLSQTLGLPSKNRIGKISTFTYSQNNAYHPVSETSVLFARDSFELDHYAYDEAIAISLGVWGFNSYTELYADDDHVALKMASVQDAAAIARELATYSLVPRVFVSPKVLNKIRASLRPSQRGFARTTFFEAAAAALAAHPALGVLGGAAISGIAGAALFGGVGAAIGAYIGLIAGALI